jgi:cell division protein FtsB
MAEEKSPLSSSEEDGRSILSLQNELKQLRRRVNDLEAENARMKEIIELFQMEGK